MAVAGRTYRLSEWVGLFPRPQPRRARDESISVSLLFPTADHIDKNLRTSLYGPLYTIICFSLSLSFLSLCYSL